MKVANLSPAPASLGENELLSEILHELSQPLTALECGVEMSLRQDKTVAKLRSRMQALLATAQCLHQRLLELRALQDAGYAGDTIAPVALENLLAQLQEDLAPIAKQGNASLSVKCVPVLVSGNATRLRNGFFQILEFLVRNCPRGGKVDVMAENHGSRETEVRFRVCAAAPAQGVNLRELNLRIARRTFQAAGGAMEIWQEPTGQIVGEVRVRRKSEPRAFRRLKSAKTSAVPAGPEFSSESA